MVHSQKALSHSLTCYLTTPFSPPANPETTITIHVISGSRINVFEAPKSPADNAKQQAEGNRSVHPRPSPRSSHLSGLMSNRTDIHHPSQPCPYIGRTAFNRASVQQLSSYPRLKFHLRIIPTTTASLSSRYLPWRDVTSSYYVSLAHPISFRSSVSSRLSRMNSVS